MDAESITVKLHLDTEEVRAVIDAMQAEIDRLRKDAERYRWIARKTSAHGICDGWQFGFPTALTLPANALAMRDPEAALGQCIDAALSEETKGRAA